MDSLLKRITPKVDNSIVHIYTLPAVSFNTVPITIGIIVNASHHNETLDVVRGTFSYTNYANENFIEENKIVKCYTLKSKSKKPRIIYVSLKKPKRDKCAFIDCAKLTPFGISSDKIDNWNDLPSEVPYDAEHFKTYYYDGVEIRFV